MNNNLSSNVNFFLGLQNQFKILHWQTKGYARHKAFGEIYETLDGLIDEYVEICMGKHGRFSLDNSTNTIQMTNLADLNIVEFLQTAKNRLIGFGSELSQERDTDLLNLRDEMLGSLNKLAYLLTLE
jgi:DNA-binding ferritin-like protein